MSKLSSYLLPHGLLAILLCLMINGCVILPIPTTEHGILFGRGAIEKEDIKLFRIGVTSREDILLHFGEPDVVTCKERIFAYSWVVKWGYLGLALGGMGDIQPMARSKILLLQFDDGGKLELFEELDFSHMDNRLESIIIRDIAAIEGWKSQKCRNESSNPVRKED